MGDEEDYGIEEGVSDFHSLVGALLNGHEDRGMRGGETKEA